MSKVIVFGSLNADLSIECDRMPRSSETIHGREFFINSGGKGGNQAVAAARMGASTVMLGCVGPDSFGRDLISSLVRHGVSCENVCVSRHYPTGTAIIMRTESDKRIIIDPGANLRTDFDTVRTTLRGLAEPGDIFLTQLECDFETTVASVIFAKEMGLVTVMNAAPAVELPDELYAALDILCINEAECEELCGIDPADSTSMRRALAFFAERGVGRTIITLGSKGSATLIDDKVHAVPSFYVEIKDTTGAGDAYLGALVTELAADRPFEEAMIVASATGALATTKDGAQQAMPGYHEVIGFLAENGHEISWSS
ncbi:ribokinase [Coriobacteriales bacterium OH1046]|nr:ribokinase [Coriobacteriales bacterium OH1046]